MLSEPLLKFLFVSYLVLFSTCLYASDSATITVDLSSEIGSVNRDIFGTAILGWEIDHGKNRKHNYWVGGDYAYGLWDPVARAYNQDAFSLLKEGHFKTIRFIGQYTDWEKSVGEYQKRDYKFGIDEQIQLANNINAEPVISLQNLDLLNSHAELVKYLQSNHPHVRYIEIGNESWYIFSAEAYAERFLEYSQTLKKINPRLKLGIVGHTPEWDEIVMRRLGSGYDFVSKHYYAGVQIGNDPLLLEPKALFLDALESVDRLSYKIQKVNSLMARMGGKKPIFITEHNTLFVQDKPTPYRHSLGTALVNAELVKLFMLPQLNVAYAHNWNFINEYFGSVANKFDGSARSLRNPYYKRPNYYLYYLYGNYFGDVLVSSIVQSGGYALSMPSSIKKYAMELRDGLLIKHDLLASAGWQVSPVDGISVRSSNGELAIRFGSHSQWNYYHAKKSTKVKPSTIYRLSGQIKVSNLEDVVGVCLAIQDARGWDVVRSAASTETLRGSTEWIDVEVLYETLPDATEVNVIARRIGSEGPLRGEVYFRNVRLEEFKLISPTKLQYLSVNASKSRGGDSVYLIVVNRNMDESVNTLIKIKGLNAPTRVSVRTLNGPSIDSTNELNPEQVNLKLSSFEASSGSFEYIFEPHSLTAIEIKKAA